MTDVSPGDEILRKGRTLEVFAVADAGVYAGSPNRGPRASVWVPLDEVVLKPPRISED